MNGLIIIPKWLDRIILYGKDIEVRGSITNHTGEKIYLLFQFVSLNLKMKMKKYA